MTGQQNVATRQVDADAWIADAPCAGRDWLFDGVATASATVRWAAAQPALEVCATCPYTAQCAALVVPPGSRFDGVAGGRLYINGRPARPPVPRAPRARMGPPRTAACGTKSGYAAHRRHGEYPCEPCRAAKAEYERRYRERVAL